MASNELRFRHVGLSSDGTVVFCEMDNGKTHAMPLQVLDRAEDWNPKAKPTKIEIIHDGYAAFVKFDSGETIDFPADFVQHLCDPSYSHYIGRGPVVSDVGARIREIRQARGLTLEALASKCGIAKPNLSRLETGKVTPKFETLRAIAAALETHPVLLVCRKNPDRAWACTQHAFAEWKLGLQARPDARVQEPLVRAVDMVRIFLATRPEYRFARRKLLQYFDRAPKNAELCKYPVDAAKWAKELATAEAIQRRPHAIRT